MTLADLLPDTLSRLEELPSDGGVAGPIFWSLTYECLPELVDAMFEAALLTGVVQAVDIPITLQSNTTYFSFSDSPSFGLGDYDGASGIPEGVIAALRMRAPWTMRKVSLKALDDVHPGWQNLAPSNQLRGWFPLGVSGFGIWPQLSVESQVVMDFITSPVNAPRPYVPTLPVPFEEQFVSAFSEYAAALLRTKELSADADEAAIVMEAYLDKMRQLSLFQSRLDSQVMTPAYGANVRVNQREVV
jgi:hypothetical protein